ncbi:MAG TPA: hypothetical protein VGI74_16540 [Streptosporangiaceae bacterium]
MPAALAALALATALAGCGGSSGSSSVGSSGGSSGNAAKTTTNSNTGPAYTVSQLRAALLTRVDGAHPAAPVQSGAYGSLPGVKASKQTLSGVTISPPRCASATATGLASSKFDSVPATVATFRVGSDGVSEVLLAPPSSMLEMAITHNIPVGCSRYHARVDGKTYTYEIKQEPAPRIGAAASELNVRAAGDSSANIWTIIYRSGGLVGAITLVGAKASRAGAESLAKLAYAQAEKNLV